MSRNIVIIVLSINTIGLIFLWLYAHDKISRLKGNIRERVKVQVEFELIKILENNLINKGIDLKMVKIKNK